MDASGKKMDEDRISLISQCSQAVGRIRKAELSEIKCFASPPVGVIDVMKGAMVLLGHRGTELDWKNIQKYLGKFGEESIQKRIEQLDFESIPPETRKQARDILCKYTTDEVTRISFVAGTVHRWAVAVADD